MNITITAAKEMPNFGNLLRKRGISYRLLEDMTGIPHERLRNYGRRNFNGLQPYERRLIARALEVQESEL